MKKYIKIVLLIIFFVFILNINEAKASTGSTVFIGEPVILDDYKDVEITYNYVEINEETSEIKNTQIFTNLTDSKVTKKASIKLEDSYTNLTINSLKIVVNGLEIQEITKEGDNYIFYFEILPNEGKKIEITYKTDNDLQNAKIIKYTMDKLKGQKVKMFDISVKLSKYDIPLVQKIWPGAYEFEENIVSTEYFDFPVNNLTSTFIIQKETYKNLKYGEYAEALSDIDEYILDHAKEFIDGNMPNIPDNIYYIHDIACKWALNREFNYRENGDSINEALRTVLAYSLITKAYGENNVYRKNEYGYMETTISFEISEEYCLAHIRLTECLDLKDKNPYGYYGEEKEYNYAVGKMVAINYYETEQGKDLYVNKDIKNLSHAVEGAEFVLMKRDEYSILRTIVAEGGPILNLNEGIKKVFVNSDIDGNKIDISEEEIIQFVNMLNVDLYIRIVLYDPSNQYPDVLVGYYTDESKEIAMEYIETKEKKQKNEKRIKELEDGTDDLFAYSWYTEERKNEDIANYKNSIEKIKTEFKMFDNEVVKNNSKIPTIAHCVGKCIYKDGKYTIEFNNPSDESGLFYIYGATECEAAKKMLASNKVNNDSIKQTIQTQINNTKITADAEEYKKRQEIVQEEVEIKEKSENKLIELLKDDIRYIILFTMILLLIILIIILTILKIRRKK